MTFISIPRIEKGGQFETVTGDTKNYLFEEILIELKIMNKHLSCMTDEEIREEDL